MTSFREDQENQIDAEERASPIILLPAASVSSSTLGNVLTRLPTTPTDQYTPNPSYPPSQADEPTWPKGWRPWTCLFGCFLLMFNSWGLVNTYGTFASYYMQHLMPGRDLLYINLIGSTQSFVVLACSAMVGRLLDAGHARKLIAIGGFLITLGMFLLSVVNGAGHRNDGNYGLIWLTQGLLVGTGMACFFVSSSQIAATWFVKRKAIAVGIVACGASIAGLIYPFMTKFLLAALGFNNAVRCVAGAIGFTCILAFLLATPNPTHVKREMRRWTEIRTWVDPDAFRNAAFCWFTAGICFMFFGFYAVFFNLEEWAAHTGFAIKDVPPGIAEVELPHEVKNDAIRTFWLLSIANGSSTFGRLFSAFFSEWLGAVNIHTISATIGGLLLLCLWTQARTLATGLSFVIVYGAVSGAIVGLPPASMAHILGRSDPHQQAKLGQWVGLMYTASAAFALTGPVIAGALISEYKGYITVQVWSGVCMLLAAACMSISRVYATKGRRREFLDGVTMKFAKVLSREKSSRTCSVEKA